jgi:transposase InsO family protein
MDFFAVEVVTLSGLMLYFALLAIDLETRRVEMAGIVRQPDGRWMRQVARNLTDVESGFLRDGYYVIHDRDPLYTAEFRCILEGAGVTTMRLPAKSPNLNAYAERFVRSIEDECLDRVVSLGEQHLRAVVSDYITHYHEEMNHQGLDNQSISPLSEPTAKTGSVKRRERVGGVLNHHCREVA